MELEVGCDEVVGREILRSLPHTARGGAGYGGGGLNFTSKTTSRMLSGMKEGCLGVSMYDTNDLKHEYVVAR